LGGGGVLMGGLRACREEFAGVLTRDGASLSENPTEATAGESEIDFELRFTRVQRDELRQQLTLAEATICYQADLERERLKVQELEARMQS
jgi:hypothetical protein